MTRTLTDELTWQLTRAKSALENWGRHHDWCGARYTVPLACSCGYEQAIADADPVTVANRFAEQTPGAPADG